MPSVIGYATEEQKEYIQEELVENGPYDSESEAIQFCIRYALGSKYNFSGGE